MEGNWEKALKNPSFGPWHWKVRGQPPPHPTRDVTPQRTETPGLGQEGSHPATTHPGGALIAVQPQQHLLLGMMLGSSPSVGTRGGGDALSTPTPCTSPGGGMLAGNGLHRGQRLQSKARSFNARRAFLAAEGHSAGSLHLGRAKPLGDISRIVHVSPCQS